MRARILSERRTCRGSWSGLASGETRKLERRLDVARIAGINLPNEKRVETGLTAIFGIGRSQSQRILSDVGIDPNVRVKDLPETEVKKLRERIEQMPVEGDLRRDVSMSLKRLTDIGTYRGIRHGKKLPVRGQRTKTNARTKRGKRVTVGSGRIKTAAKT